MEQASMICDDLGFSHGAEDLISNAVSRACFAKKRKDLTDEERLNVFMTLVKDFNGKKLQHGYIKKYAADYSVSSKTVSRIWRLGSNFIDTGDVVDVSRKLFKHVGRKKIELDLEKMKQIPLSHRKTMASLGHALQVSKSTIHRRVKDGDIRRHTNAIKPQLTEENKKARLRFCMSMLNLNEELEENNEVNEPVPSPLQQLSNPNFSGRSQVQFKDMFNYVFIDEKWFFMSKEKDNYYLTADELEPHRTCKSKKFITKVMFLAAVARPRFDEDGNNTFDGKIGIFPFTYKEPARRSSKNRAAGTLETKPIPSITKDVIRSCLIDKVLPAIKAKWPECSRNSPIYIQQDNAKPDIDASDEAFVEAAGLDGFDIRLTRQPPNSPDFNTLDLGYFRSIDSLKLRASPKTTDELVAAVENSFQELSPHVLNRVFLTYQQCMIEVMKCKGDNNYRIPHMGKDALEKENRLPKTLSCDRGIVAEVIDHLGHLDS